MSFYIRMDSIKKQREQKRNNVVDPRDRKDMPINVMERDSVMKHMIKEGRIDRSLKKDAEIIQREYENKRKEKTREQDQKDLHEMKKKYGLLPEQLKRAR